ncbi:hypothetical protein PMAYCL1PPCAC_14106, partial [Pristionchus mayeri]
MLFFKCRNQFMFSVINTKNYKQQPKRMEKHELRGHVDIDDITEIFARNEGLDENRVDELNGVLKTLSETIQTVMKSRRFRFI